MKASISYCVFGSLITGMLLASTWSGWSAELQFDDYTVQSLKQQEGQMREGARRGRQRNMEQLLEGIEKGNTGLARVLGESNFPPDEVMPILRRLLEHTNAEVRVNVLIGVRGYGTNALPLMGQLLRILSGRDEILAWRAADVISAIGAPAGAAVPALVKWLATDVGFLDLRLATISALRSIGPAAAAAIPVLEQELASKDAAWITNRNSISAYGAYVAIGEIRAAPPLSREEILAGGLELFDGPQGYRAFQGLKQKALSEQETLQLVSKLFSRNTPLPARIAAVEVVGDLHPVDPASISYLINGTRQKESAYLADLSALTLGKNIARNTNSMEMLIQALNPDEPIASVAASKALANSAAFLASSVNLDSIVGILGRCTGTTETDVIGGYLDILRALGPRAASASPLLTSWLKVNAPVYQGRVKSSATFVRKYALLALCEVGMTSDAIPAIIDELVNAPHLANRAAAARAAGAVPDHEDKVVPFLIAQLKKLQPREDAGAVNLNIIGMKGFIPGDPVTSLPLEAIHALERLGPAASSAVPVLRERAQDPPFGVAYYYLPYQAEAARVASLLSK